MTLDKLVADDLAALAADSRRQLRSLDDSLRALRARRSADQRATGDAGADRPADATAGVGVPELALLRFAGVYIARAGHAAAGGAALLCTLVMFGALCLGRLDGFRAPSWMVLSLDRNVVSIASLLVVLALAARAVAASIAARRLERLPALTQPDGFVMDLGDHHTPFAWSVAPWIAGIAGAVILVAVISCVVGRQPWTAIWWHRDEFDALFADRLRDLAGALPGTYACAVALGRAARRGSRWPRLLEHPAAVCVLVAIALVPLYIELTVDAPALTWSNRNAIASSGLRTALAAGITPVALLMATSMALRQHRREQRVLAQIDLAPLPAAGPALLASAAVIRARAARIAAGAMAVVWTIALLVITHNPFGYTDRGGIGASPDDAWWRWAFEDHLTAFAVIAVLVLTAHRLGGRLADRALRHRLVGLADPGCDAVDIGHRLARRLDGWSVALGLAGLIALVLMLSIIYLTAGVDLWVLFEHHGGRVQTVLTNTLHQATAAIPIGFVAAAVLGRSCAREARTAHRSRWLAMLEHRGVPVGLAIGLIATVAWMGLDFGAFAVSATVADQLGLAVRLALTTAITVAVLLVSAGVTLRSRRREQDRLGLRATAR